MRSAALLIGSAGTVEVVGQALDSWIEDATVNVGGVRQGWIVWLWVLVDVVRYEKGKQSQRERSLDNAQVDGALLLISGQIEVTVGGAICSNIGVGTEEVVGFVGLRLRIASFTTVERISHKAFVAVHEFFTFGVQTILDGTLGGIPKTIKVAPAAIVVEVLKTSGDQTDEGAVLLRSRTGFNGFVVAELLERCHQLEHVIHAGHGRACCNSKR